MNHVLIISISLICSVNSNYGSDYDENTPRQFIEKLNALEYNEGIVDEPEPVNPFTTTLLNNSTNTTTPIAPLEFKNIWCEDFEDYASNCTDQAKRIYNSTINLPLSRELHNWCSALKLLATCMSDWNTDCRDVTEKNFNELTIQGQLHVLNKVCHDNWFSVQYNGHLDICINEISKDWTACFLGLKYHTDQRKNSTKNWVHYETHFYLCCARTRFRHCTLEVLIKFSYNCTTQQSILLQKFSAIISEGEVFQDCNFNMMYPSCPGGDPRPPTFLVAKLTGEDVNYLQQFENRALQSTTTRSTIISVSGTLMILFLLLKF